MKSNSLSAKLDRLLTEISWLRARVDALELQAKKLSPHLRGVEAR